MAANIDGGPADEGRHLPLLPPSLDVGFNKTMFGQEFMKRTTKYELPAKKVNQPNALCRGAISSPILARQQSSKWGKEGISSVG